MFRDRIKTIFFDLDNTLFDHARAERTALVEILNSHLQDGAVELFVAAYHRVNAMLWRQMAEGEIAAEALKVQRFKMVFDELGLPSPDCVALSQDYLEVYSGMAFTVPGAREVLADLSKNYVLGVLSNGFPPVQRNKLAATGLESFFVHQVFSGDVGAMKPSRKIFDFAADLSAAAPGHLAYVGDSFESDVVGAKNAGWLAIFFDPENTVPLSNQADARISSLSELTILF